jgi:hypothetical protein
LKKIYFEKIYTEKTCMEKICMEKICMEKDLHGKRSAWKKIYTEMQPAALLSW